MLRPLTCWWAPSRSPRCWWCAFISCRENRSRTGFSALCDGVRVTQDLPGRSKQQAWDILFCGVGHPVLRGGNLISVTSNYPAPNEELMPHFVRDIQEIRQRAIHKMEDGAVTESYKGDVNKTVEILNEALATEIVCVLRYMHHYFMATGVHAKSVADEFKEHADDEREHAD